MGIRFLDSFDHYATADLLSKWGSSSGSVAINAATGRFRSSASLRFSNFNQSLALTLDSQAYWVVGFAFKLSTLNSGDIRLFAFKDGATIQMELLLTAGGNLKVRRNGTTLTGGTSSLTFSANTWNFLEWKCYFSDSISANQCVVKLNGVEFINLAAGTDTKQTTNATADTIQFCADFNEARTLDIDDLYLLDGSGSSNTDFLGDCTVEAIFPSGDGNYSQWTGSDGNSTNNSLLVDESAPNADTDYVESGTVNQIDSYAFGDLTGSPSQVFGVQALIYAKKTDVGARSLASFVRLSATDYVGSTHALGNSYTYYRHIRDKAPGEISPWAAADVNNAEFGVKLIA